jgi:hypothetical protein
LRKLHKILPKQRCQQKSEGKHQFFHFCVNDHKIGWFIPFWKRFFILSPDLKAA